MIPVAADLAVLVLVRIYFSFGILNNFICLPPTRDSTQWDLITNTVGPLLNCLREISHPYITLTNPILKSHEKKHVIKGLEAMWLNRPGTIYFVTQH